jgi:DNA-binding PadR family transcriptional regulator
MSASAVVRRAGRWLTIGGVLALDVGKIPTAGGIVPARADVVNRLPVAGVYSHNVSLMTPKGVPSLAEFELLVLLAALRLGPEDAYTVSIAEEIEQRTGRGVRRANVYTTLQRLEEKRLIATTLGAARAERGGKPRRLVTVRPSGVAAVRAAASGIQAMVAGLTDLIGETS